MKKPTNVLPCGTCTLCCRGESILIHPQDGDIAANYETITVPHPLSGHPVLMIKPKEDGTTVCRYLGPFGCSIYDKRPVICRSFDCRRLVLKIPKPMEDRIIAAGGGDREVFNKGRAMLKAHPL